MRSFPFYSTFLTLLIVLGGILFSGAVIGHSELLDFKVFWHAAERVSKGESLYASLITFAGSGPGEVRALPYLYPPLLAFLLSPLTQSSFADTAFFWTVLNFLSFAGSIYLFTSLAASLVNPARAPQVKTWFPVVLIAFWPMWYALLIGQPTGLLCLLTALFMRAMFREDTWLAGACLAALITLKLSPFMLLFAVLLLRQTRLVVTSCGFLIAIVSLLACAPGGWSSWRDFFVLLPRLNIWESQPPVQFSLSPWSLLVTPPESSIVSLIAVVIAPITIAIPLLAMWKSAHKGERHFTFVHAVVAMVMCSPILWIHHFPLLGAAAAIYVGSRYAAEKVLTGAVVVAVALSLGFGHFLFRSVADSALGLDLTRILPSIIILCAYACDLKVRNASSSLR